MWKKLNLLLLMTLAAAAQPGGRGAQPQAPATGTASIAGRVLDSAGAPVRRAVVTVEGESRSQRTAKGLTAEDGSFLINDLPKGRYWITAEKTGFLRGSYRGRSVSGYGDPVTLADGTAKSGVDITLPKQGVISGRVVDEAGEPVERVSVMAIPVRNVTSRGGGASSTSTNDLGEFRLAKLPPGNYRLQASRNMDRGEILVERIPGKPSLAEAPTYFPGTIEAASATPIRVNPGEERTGAEIRMQRSTVVTVAGRVAGDLPARRGARVAMRPTSDVVAFRGFMGMGGGDGSIAADGTFTFRNVRAGEYTMSVMTMDSGGPKVLGKQVLVVGQQDLTGLTINAAAPPKVDGRVRADGEPPFAFGKLDVVLVGMGGGREMGPPVTAKTDDNGLFSFPSVSRERQAVSVKTPTGVIVKAIYAAGQPLAGLDVDFATVTGPLEIVLSNKPASIAGTVEGVNPDAPRIGIWAVPDGQPLTVESWNTKKLRVESSTPTFTLDSLRPGTYRVAAVEDAETDALSDPGWWERLKDRVTTVKVGEGEAAQLKLRLIPAKELDEN